VAGATYPWALNEAGVRLRAGERRADGAKYDEGVAVEGVEGVGVCAADEEAVGVSTDADADAGGMWMEGLVPRRERERDKGEGWELPADEEKRSRVDRPERVLMRLWERAWAGMDVVGSAERVDDFCVVGMAAASALAMQGSMLHRDRSEGMAPRLAASGRRQEENG
jgi:hypothetical protein